MDFDFWIFAHGPARMRERKQMRRALRGIAKGDLGDETPTGLESLRAWLAPAANPRLAQFLEEADDVRARDQRLLWAGVGLQLVSAMAVFTPLAPLAPALWAASAALLLAACGAVLSRSFSGTMGDRALHEKALRECARAIKRSREGGLPPPEGNSGPGKRREYDLTPWAGYSLSADFMRFKAKAGGIPATGKTFALRGGPKNPPGRHMTQ